MADSAHEKTLTLTVNGRAFAVTAGRRLDDVLVELQAGGGADLLRDAVRPCGGFGLCGRCRVTVIAPVGAVNAPTEDERLHFSDEELVAGVRLACRTVVQDDCAVWFGASPPVELN